jgi:YggT family protein
MNFVATLLGSVLLLFELVMIARVVLDWVGVLAASGGGGFTSRARMVTHAWTEPVIAPVRRVLPPLRLGGAVSLDLAFTVVFVAVLVLRTVVAGL